MCTPVEIITGQLDLPGGEHRGGGLQHDRAETAEILSHRDRNNAVLVLEAAPGGPGGLWLQPQRGHLGAGGEQCGLLTNRTLTKVGAGPDLVCGQPDREEYVYPCDRVVLALGTTPPLCPGGSPGPGGKVFRWGTRPKAARSGTPSTTATTPPAACEAPAAPPPLFTEETWKFNKTLLEYFTGIGYDLDSEK